MSSVTFNVILSGVSASGALDTGYGPLKIDLGTTDKIGMATFHVNNQNGAYLNFTSSGNPTCQIDAIKNGVTLTVFRGTVERVEQLIDVTKGTVTRMHAYDFGKELLYSISPDARAPSPSSSGLLGIQLGDQGIAVRNGFDIVSYTSGVNFGSGASVAQFMSQWFGTQTDPSGTQSGTMLSFKPFVSGYTYKTWYKPDGSPDNNLNFFIPFNGLKVKREYAWDALRKITRQSLAIDNTGARVNYELYIGVSGDLHLFTSGSSEFVASGVNLIYYIASASGASNNNIIQASIPNDLGPLKNRITGWFPAWTSFPGDNLFTDFVAYSGGYWSGLTGKNFSGTVISGDSPATAVGRLSIQATASGGTISNNNEDFQLIYTFFSGASINLQKFNVSGTNVGVNLTYYMRWSGNVATQEGTNTAWREVSLIDTSGKAFIKSGTTGGDLLVGSGAAGYPNSAGIWTMFTDVIYGSGGVFNSGTGANGGWLVQASADITRIKQLQFGLNFQTVTGNVPSGAWFEVDAIQFNFNYQFSPVVVFNSGSFNLYGLRYSTLEWPYSVSDVMASGIMTNEINSRMTSKTPGQFKIRDTGAGMPNQLTLKPGQIVVIDAPTLGTGSGQGLLYWKAMEITHEYSHDGFYTIIKAVPWFSGTLTSPNSNFIDFQRPLLYTQPPPAERPQYAPLSVPWGSPAV